MRRLTVAPQAERDLHDILVYSEARFGPDAAERYRRLIDQALTELLRDPESAQGRGHILSCPKPCASITFATRRRPHPVPGASVARATCSSSVSTRNMCASSACSTTAWTWEGMSRAMTAHEPHIAGIRQRGDDCDGETVDRAAPKQVRAVRAEAAEQFSKGRRR